MMAWIKIEDQDIKLSVHEAKSCRIKLQEESLFAWSQDWRIKLEEWKTKVKIEDLGIKFEEPRLNL